MSILEQVKNSIGIAGSIITYDEELMFWIKDAKDSMIKTAGVPESLLSDGKEDTRAVAAIIFYVKANFGNDRTDSNKYMDLFRKKLRQLQTEDGGIWDVEE